METSYAFLNAYFDKIFVVSLQRATDRHATLAERLKGLNYEIFWAKDKQDFTLEEVIRQGIYDEKKALTYNRHGAKKLATGEVACAWSHRTVYEIMVAEGLQRVLVFEDDVEPNPDRLALLPNTLRQLPSDWELVYLGFLKNEEVLPKHRRKRQFYKLLATFKAYKWLTRKEVNNLYPRPFSENLRTAGLHDCTHAYAVTHSAAQKLCKAQTPIYSSADELLTHEVLRGHLKAFICNPTFFDQKGFSGIGHRGEGSYVSD
ncbi:MAG: glycosyltransferase family 25 protein [Spirosomataceae bacterium]